MDPDAWLELAAALNERPCPFEQAILSGSASCAQARRLYLGERHAVQCSLQQAQARCLELLKTLREQARFTLKSKSATAGASLHHNQSLRLQIGGLRGLSAALDPEGLAPHIVQDIDALIDETLARFGSFCKLPYPLILRAIARYQPRRGRHPR